MNTHAWIIIYGGKARSWPAYRRPNYLFWWSNQMIVSLLWKYHAVHLPKRTMQCWWKRTGHCSPWVRAVQYVCCRSHLRQSQQSSSEDIIHGFIQQRKEHRLFNKKGMYRYDAEITHRLDDMKPNDPTKNAKNTIILLLQIMTVVLSLIQCFRKGATYLSPWFFRLIHWILWYLGFGALPTNQPLFVLTSIALPHLQGAPIAVQDIEALSSRKIRSKGLVFVKGPFGIWKCWVAVPNCQAVSILGIAIGIQTLVVAYNRLDQVS